MRSLSELGEGGGEGALLDLKVIGEQWYENCATSKTKIRKKFWL